MPPEDLHGLIDALVQTPKTVAGLVEGLSDSGLKIRKSREEFSVVEHVCHLRDIEIEGYTSRINRILKEDNPHLPDIDGSRLAIEREYQSQNISDALKAFAEARKQNTQTLKSLASVQFNRIGNLEGVGSVTIRELLMMMRDHDADHVRELSAICKRPMVARN